MKTKDILIGPFSEIIPMSDLATRGPLKDDDLRVIKQGGILISGSEIKQVGTFDELRKNFSGVIYEITEPSVVLPGFIDSHTHICYAGSRARDYTLRCAGISYQEIAKLGGGILDTVAQTRNASSEDLKINLMQRANRHLKNGVTTCEVKSGYGLTVLDEIKMLRAIQEADLCLAIDLIPTCLAAHTLPKEFKNPEDYLNLMLSDLLPKILSKKLAKRLDIYIEHGAFDKKNSMPYLRKAKDLGFALTIHADQFSVGGSELACELGALSADHLEVSSDKEITALAEADVIATVLPGASLGLGMSFAPARKLLDAGCTVVIASDWNPGTAPMGDLLMQASVLGAAQKMTNAETLSGLTCRAALALELLDRGQIASSKLADFILFPCHDYREILYHQGSLRPCQVWKKSEMVSGKET